MLLFHHLLSQFVDVKLKIAYLSNTKYHNVEKKKESKILNKYWRRHGKRDCCRKWHAFVKMCA